MKIIFLSNIGSGLYKFRKELIKSLLDDDYDVCVSFPSDEYVGVFEEMGCTFYDNKIDRRGKNIFNELKTIMSYLKVIRAVKPDLVITYTIKPNIYGGLLCSILNIPYFMNITGLGTGLLSNNMSSRILKWLYRIVLKKCSCLFFQNESNVRFFEESDLVTGKFKLVSGSGVNLDDFSLLTYPKNTEKIKFLFIGRVMREKGINEFLESAKFISSKYDNVEFGIVGFIEDDYSDIMKEFTDNGIVEYYGYQSDVKMYIETAHAIVLPSYHEGLSNVLLESAASGRPVLASNIPGCLETFEEGLSGYGFEVRNVESLISSLEKFINLTSDQRSDMGIFGRKKMELEYNRTTVVNIYKEEIAIMKERLY
jgi:galacturonosyltransferase